MLIALFLFAALLLAVLATPLLWGAIFLCMLGPAWLRFGMPKGLFIAQGLTVVVIFAVPLAVNLPTYLQATKLRSSEREPPRPVQLRGLIQIERTGSGAGGAFCDDLCRAVLFTPGVEGVVVQPQHAYQKPSAFDCRDCAQGLVAAAASDPYRPVAAFFVEDGAVCSPPGWSGRNPEEDPRTPPQARTGPPDCLRTPAPRRRPDLTVAVGHWMEGGWRQQADWSLKPSPRSIARVELRDPAGAVLLRKTRVGTDNLAYPLRIGTRGEMGGLGFSLGWKRKAVSSGFEAGPTPASAQIAQLSLAAPPKAEGRRSRAAPRTSDAAPAL